MSRAIDLPTKTSFYKVTFNWDPTDTNQFQRYTDAPTNLPGGFTSRPQMFVELPKNTGTLEKKECKIELPLDTFTTRMTNGYPHAAVKVIVQEVLTPTDPSQQATLLTVFRGRVTHARRNPAGKAGIVRFLCEGPKSRLKARLGLPVMHHCPFDTYGPSSQLDRVNFRSQRRIDDITGNVITIDADPMVSPPNNWFKNGYIEFEGLTIKIREWDATVDPKIFTLIEPPPIEWLDEFVNIFAGSNHTIEDVRDKLSNEEHFGGIGYKIPPYHPSFEDAPNG